MNNDKIKMTSLSFRKEFMKPDEERDRTLGFVKWGKKNDYPFFLLDLYNGSAWHQGIVKTKTFYIAGGGLEIVTGDMQAFIDNLYCAFDMNEIAEQLAFDFELFGGFAVKGTWNREGTRVAKWEYLDVDAIRMTEDERNYFISDDWTAMNQSSEKTNLRMFPALDESNKVGQFIIYYKEPAKRSRKEKGIYPKPTYNGGLTAIQTDCDIAKFHMYELQNGFKSGTLINMPSGFPESTEELHRITESIKGRTQSVEDAGEIIITFSDGADLAPSVQQLNGNDLDKRYEVTAKSVQQNILVAHSVTAPTLFGVMQEGSFNAAESGDLFEIFKTTYVSTRQKRIEWMLNYMAKLGGYIGKVKLIDVLPLNLTPTNEVIMPIPVANCKHDFSKDEISIFSEFGENKDNYIVLSSHPIAWDTSSEEVFARQDMIFETIGEIKLQIKDFDKNVLNLLKQGEDATSIAKALNTKVEAVAKSINQLSNWELYQKGNTTNLGDSILKDIKIEIDEFEVRYSYRTRNDVPPVQTESREFCERLLGLNRIYTRQEIDLISSRVERNVWTYRGGWYTNPDTKKTTPWCRHEWVQQLVIKQK
jgi:hypothetical protein